MDLLLRLNVAAGSVFISAILERYRRWGPIRNEAELRRPGIASAILEALIGAPGPALYFAFALNAARSGFGVSGLILNPYFLLVLVFFDGEF